MSAIGRVFIVLNLALAFVFVGFAGTYLQHSTNWKLEYEKKKEEHAAYQTSAEAELKATNEKYNVAQRNSSSLDQQIKAKTTELADAKAENDRLNKQLSDMQADLKQLNSNYSTVASNLERATDESHKAYKTAMEESQKSKEAKDAQVAAQGEARDAQLKIKDLENKLAEQGGQLAKANEDIGEQRILLNAIKTRYPGVVDNIQPDIKGKVFHVADNKLVTFEITAKAADVKPGYRMSIFNGSGYKGEAVITSVDGNMAFGRVLSKKDGADIKVGDEAATNLGN